MNPSRPARSPCYTDTAILVSQRRNYTEHIHGFIENRPCGREYLDKVSNQLDSKYKSNTVPMINIQSSCFHYRLSVFGWGDLTVKFLF
jgi:hypothetical protein